MTYTIPSRTTDYLAQRLDGARDLYLLALALGERDGPTGTFSPLIQEARIHFASVIEEARIAGLDTHEIAGILGKMTRELRDSVRPEIWERLAEVMAERPRRKSA